MKTKYVWLFIFAIIACIAGFDVMLYSDDVIGNSITQVLIAFIGSSPLAAGGVGFIFGALFFHLFDTKKEGE